MIVMETGSVLEDYVSVMKDGQVMIALKEK
jgi:hypothetical protein